MSCEDGLVANTKQTILLDLCPSLRSGASRAPVQSSNLGNWTSKSLTAYRILYTCTRVCARRVVQVRRLCSSQIPLRERWRSAELWESVAMNTLMIIVSVAGRILLLYYKLYILVGLICSVGTHST